MKAVPIALLALVALFVGAQSLEDTTNLRYRGYTMTSNVAGYTNMTLDFCDIQSAVSAGNFTRALQLYEEGKNSAARTGLRKFMQWSVAQHPGEPTYDFLLAYHKNASWLDTAVRTAVTKKSGSQLLALISVGVQFKYFWHEVDAAATRTASNQTDPVEGAPHNLDEAWALFAGAHPKQCTSLLSISDKLAGEMGTAYYGVSPIGLSVVHLMNDLQYYALTGNSTVALVNSTRQAMHVQVASLLAQGFMREAYAAYVGGVCKTPATVTASRDAAVAWWSILAPQLTAFGAKSADLTKVATALTATNVQYTQVVSALTKVLGPVNAASLGKPVFSKINTDPKCKL